MSEDVDTMSRLQAERLMGQAITADELQRTVASLIIQLDKLNRVFTSLSSQIWSEDKLRSIIGDEMSKRCKLLHATDKENTDKVTSKWLSVGGKPAWIISAAIGVAIIVISVLYMVNR